MNLEQSFYDVFKVQPEYRYSAPARINLIGEHIDYNGGKVLPCAISCYIKALVSKRDDDVINAYSLNVGKGQSASIPRLQYQKEFGWCNYVFGAFVVLRSMGYRIPHGLNILINSTIPLGSGLSSSAALLDLIVYLANDIYKLDISLKNIAKIAQKVENQYLGLKSGIMDEAAIALGLKDKCLLLDCDKYEYQYIDLRLGDYVFAVMKTNKPRSLIKSNYNERVQECQTCLSLIQKEIPVNNLCEVSIDDLPKVQQLINNQNLFKRARHVIKENHRVYQFVRALDTQNIQALGQLLDESHKSLKEDYEVTGTHLDFIVKYAKDAGAIGARMTGAGFGGCAIALIDKKTFPSFKEYVERKYYEKFKLQPEVFLVDIVDGPEKEEEYEY